MFKLKQLKNSINQQLLPPPESKSAFSVKQAMSNEDERELDYFLQATTEFSSLTISPPSTFCISLTGTAVPASIAKLKTDLQHHEVYRISKDGSCWNRALWQTIFHQIFSDKRKFNAFVSKAQFTKIKFAHDIRFKTDNNIEKLISILKTLNAKNFSERLTALNDVKVDAILNNFMRKVCAGLLRLCDQEKTNETQSYINNIENPDVYGGAIEINAFLNFFALSAHEIAIIHNIEGEKLQHHVYNKTSKQELKLPATIMFASSSLHYDVLIRKNYIASATS